MIDYVKEKIILLGVILGGILSLTSCGPQERGNVPYTAESREAEEYTGDIQIDAGDGGAATGTLSEMAELIPETASEILPEEDNIDVSEISNGAEVYLADLDIHPLYVAFLRNEISVPNPFVSGSELSFFDDRDYAQEEHVFEYADKSFSLVDVNNDGASELIFRIYDSPDELIHFVRERANSDSGLYYDYYYMNGDETAKCSLESNEEYETLVSPYEGGEPEWFFCDSFADILAE